MTSRHSHLPKISVVVPSYNQGSFLPEALNSIFSQNYPNLEVVVMDGGSTDESVSIIKSYSSRLKHWQSGKDGGQSAAINAGMRHCSGDIVAWLNSDDFYWGNALWSIGQAYLEHPKHGLYVGNGMRYDQNTRFHTPFCSRHTAFDRSALVYGTDFLLQPSTFFLREAWESVNGLNLHLHYCMDWDIFIRISKRFSAVVLQEFLAVSREYENTKTRNGKMKRAAEIVQMIQSHTGTEITPGSLLFLLESLLDATQNAVPEEVRHQIGNAHGLIARRISTEYGGGHGFPERSDQQDKIYLPFATSISANACPLSPTLTLPIINIVVPTIGSSHDLNETLRSIKNQHYEHIRVILVDQKPHCGLIDLAQIAQVHLSCWTPAPNVNLVNAINLGMLVARGEICAWIRPGDLLAEGALKEVVRAFDGDEALDLIYGNALTIDDQGEMFLADNGYHRTALWLGEFCNSNSWPAYESDVYTVPQPTIFFRRRLLERHGFLDESYPYICDYEFFIRCEKQAKIRKIERILALCRARKSRRNLRNKMLEELYTFSRQKWPPFPTMHFLTAFWGFLGGFLNRKFDGHPRSFFLYFAAAIATLAVLTRAFNPERWWKTRLPRVSKEALHVRLPARWCGISSLISEPVKNPLFEPAQNRASYHSLYCAPAIEGSDLQIVKDLGKTSTIEYFSQNRNPCDPSCDPLTSYVDIIHTSTNIGKTRPDLIYPKAARRPLFSQIASFLRSAHVPVPGPKYPNIVGTQMPFDRAFLRAAIIESLELNRPDFVFVSRQDNPIALVLDGHTTATRLILIVHEIEADRLERMAHSQHGLLRIATNWEARRARVFETINLNHYDGVIAICAHVRQRLIEVYMYPPERIHVYGQEYGKTFSEWLGIARRLPRRNAQPFPLKHGNSLRAGTEAAIGKAA